jgi:hypothetical protein
MRHSFHRAAQMTGLHPVQLSPVSALLTSAALEKQSTRPHL